MTAEYVRRTLVVVLAFGGIPLSVPARSQDPVVPVASNQNPQAVGEYLLVGANGQELPALVSENGESRQEVIGGSIRLEADGSLVWRTLYRFTEGGGGDVGESSGRGTYVQEDTSIIARFEVGDDGCCQGTLDGNRLTIEADVPMLYRKIFAQRPTQTRIVPDPVGALPPPPPGLPPNSVMFGPPRAPGDSRTDLPALSAHPPPARQRHPGRSFANR